MPENKAKIIEVVRGLSEEDMVKVRKEGGLVGKTAVVVAKAIQAAEMPVVQGAGIKSGEKPDEANLTVLPKNAKPNQ
ncbi:MAG: hypothetical protein Q7S61_03170 [bacterium]|nr:hypothetical protein [bacterium]